MHVPPDFPARSVQYGAISNRVQEICSNTEVPIFFSFTVVNTRSSVLYQQQHCPSNNDVHLDYTKRTLGRASQGNTILQYKDRLENAAWVNTDGTL